MERTIKSMEEIRVKKYYLPDLELLILTPVAVKTQMQRQHISKELLEYGLEKAKEADFQSSYQFGIEAGPNIKLPSPDCLMVKEWVVES